MKTSRREEEYIKQYRETGDKKYRDMAIDEMRDLIFSNVKSMNLSQGVDTRTLYLKGIGLAKDAVETWDGDKAKLSTHVINSMKPLHRDIYKYGPTLHVPEHSIKTFGEFKKVYEEYTNEYGDKDPDPVVLADMSGLSVSKVREFLLRERKTYNTSTQSFRPAEYVSSDHRLDTEYLTKQFDSDPVQKKVWAHIKKSLDSADRNPPNAREVHRKTGGSYYEINKAYNEIIGIINDYLRLSQ